MSQGQYQPPRKTAQSNQNSFRHIYTEDGDIKNGARPASGSPSRTASTTTAQRSAASRAAGASASSARPAAKGNTSPQSRVQKAPQAKKSPKPHGKIGQFLEKIPYAAGIALCVVMLLVSVYAGNARALSSAASSAMNEWEVSDYIDGRVGEARNLLTLCKRNGISSEIITALSDATDALDQVNDRSVSLVIAHNQSLETAASNASAALLAGNLSKTDEQSLSSTMDDFREQGNFLRQEARSYNEEARKALELYDKLPAKFLLSRPQLANIE